MIFRVPVTQIPQLWEHIKYAAVMSDSVSEEYRQVYCNYLLIDLLSGKKHVLIMVTKDKILQLLMVASFRVSKITGDKHLYLNNLYAWEKTTDEEKVDFFKSALTLGKANDCKCVEAITANPKLQEIATLFDVANVQQHYLFKV